MNLGEFNRQTTLIASGPIPGPSSLAADFKFPISLPRPLMVIVAPAAFAVTRWNDDGAGDRKLKVSNDGQQQNLITKQKRNV
jgi:hypothetical protein